MRRLALPAMVAGVLTASLGLAVTAEAATWNVKIDNLTTGQPMSPPLWVSHTNKLDVWSVGEQATNGHALIAEDAANAPLQALLSSDRRVRGAATVAGGPIPPGTSREFQISTRGNYNRVTMLWMLVRSNDAFSGLDSLKVSGNGKTKTTNAYDAGTEKNNEMGAFIPGPPFGNFFVRDIDAQLIRRHPGIVNGDLAPYAWTDPVARVTITKP